MNPITFLDYDKISDVLMYFNQEICFKFNVSLSKKSKDGKRIPFHSEYCYTSKYGVDAYSIKRNICCFFSIDDAKDFNNNIMIRPQDVYLLEMILTNNLLPWIIGSKRIYGFDDKNNLIIKGKYTQVDFPLSDYKYLSFLPIVITYTDGTSKEGIRMIINDPNNIVDMDVNRFMEFYYYISRTDIYNAALSMINYVKMKPYNVGLYSFDGSGNSGHDNSNDWNNERGNNNFKGNNFFNNLK